MARSALKRVNIVLHESTLVSIDRLAPAGQRSRFIERAVQDYVATSAPEALQRRLMEAAIRDRDLDLGVVNDWLEVDREQWRKLYGTAKRPKGGGRKEAKSTSQRLTRRAGMKSRKPVQL